MSIIRSRNKIFFPNFNSELFASIKRIFQEHGYQLCDEPEYGNTIFHIDTKKGIYKDKQNILLQLEPKCVDYGLYSPSLLTKYDLVIPLGRYRAEQLGNDIWIDLPIQKREAQTFHTLRGGTIMINAAKYSALACSNYGLRRHVLELDSKRGNQIHLYGDHWNEGTFLEFRRRIAVCRNVPLKEINLDETFGLFGKKYAQFKGKVDLEFNGVERYQTAIVIENQSDYVSEKVWQFLFKGVVPIYVGPELCYDKQIEEFVEVSKPDPQAILDSAYEFTEEKRMAKMQAFTDFLQNESFESYSAETLGRNFVKMLLDKKVLV